MRFIPSSTLFPYTTLFRSNLGGAYVEQGRLPDAIVQYSEVLRLSRDKAPWYAVLGWLYARSGRVDEALPRSEEHTSELQSLRHLVCRLLLEKKKKII